MRTNRSLFPLLALAFGIWLCFTGCSKSQLNNANYTLYDHTTAEEAYNDMFLLVCEKGDPYEVAYRDPDSCYSVIASGDSSSPTYTFSFVNNCTPQYGAAVRKGSLTISFSGNFGTQGTVATVTPGSGYYYNNYLVQGVMTVTNMGVNGAGQQIYQMTVTKSNITNPTNQAITWTCNRVMTRSFHDLIFNDIYSIKGTATGVDHDGYAFNAAVADSLQKQLTCKWPYKGNLTITITGLDTKYVQYGASGCNDSTCCNNEVYVKTGSSGENSVLLN